MRTASTSERPNKSVLANAIKTFNVLRERANKLAENAPASQRRAISDAMCDVLPTIREGNPKLAKSVRRNIRALGWFISRDGYPVAKKSARKRERKNVAQPTDSNVTQDVPATENANA
jgi:hypothetical protein